MYVCMYVYIYIYIYIVMLTLRMLSYISRPPEVGVIIMIVVVIQVIVSL